MYVCICVCVGGCGVRGQLAVVFRNKGCFLWLDVAAVGGAVRVCVCDGDRSSSSKVLNFTNDLTMPPGAGPAPLATLFICLSLYLDRLYFFQELDFSLKISTLSH